MRKGISTNWAHAVLKSALFSVQWHNTIYSEMPRNLLAILKDLVQIPNLATSCLNEKSKNYLATNLPHRLPLSETKIPLGERMNTDSICIYFTTVYWQVLEHWSTVICISIIHYSYAVKYLDHWHGYIRPCAKQSLYVLVLSKPTPPSG